MALSVPTGKQNTGDISPFKDMPGSIPDNENQLDFSSIAPKQFSPQKGHDTMPVIEAFTGVLD